MRYGSLDSAVNYNNVHSMISMIEVPKLMRLAGANVRGMEDESYSTILVI